MFLVPLYMSLQYHSVVLGHALNIFSAGSRIERFSLQRQVDIFQWTTYQAECMSVRTALNTMWLKACVGSWWHPGVADMYSNPSTLSKAPLWVNSAWLSEVESEAFNPK